jgi:hypothetical protein
MPARPSLSGAKTAWLGLQNEVLVCKSETPPIPPSPLPILAAGLFGSARDQEPGSLSRVIGSSSAALGFAGVRREDLVMNALRK